MNECKSDAQLAYLKKIRIHKFIVILCRLAIVFLFLFSWEYFTDTKKIDSFIFSSPSRIYKLFIEMCMSKELFTHSGITIMETIVSFSLVNILGITLAIVLYIWNTLSEIVEPFLVVLNSLPKSALAPVLIVWLGNNMKTIIVAAVSVAVFGTVITIFTCFKEVDKDKIKLIYTLGGNKRNVLSKVLIPHSVPTIISTMKVNVGLSLVGVIIGEFLAANKGLGYLIIYGSQVFKLDLVILSIFLLCLLSVILYTGINILEKLVVKSNCP